MGEIWTYTTPRTPALSEARAAGAKRYFTGKPCRNGHVAERIVSSRECCGCIPAKNAEQYARPDNRRKVASANWRAKNPGYQNTAAHAESVKKWAAKNKEKLRLTLKRRDLRFKLATLPLDEEGKRQLQAYYVEARTLSDSTGIPHEVDHIIPLSGKTVSGLHVPWNLRVVTRTVNRRKYNFVEI